jgi:hypothetical protein
VNNLSASWEIANAVEEIENGLGGHLVDFNLQQQGKILLVPPKFFPLPQIETD